MGGKSLLGFVALALMVGCGGNRDSSPDSASLYPKSVGRMAALVSGSLLYATDNDDVLPLAGKWMDGTEPYLSDGESFRSPAVQEGYGYALNIDLAGDSLSSTASKESAILLFDSTDLSFNATASLATLPVPPRYGTKNTIGYADGHVQDEDLQPGYVAFEKSRERLGQVAIGMLMYSGDYDDVMPAASNWLDAMMPYVKSEFVFKSPAVQAADPGAYGYAFHDALPTHRVTDFENLASTISFFDSAILTRNATASTSTLPDPARYPKGNTIAFLDGHVGGPTERAR